MTSVLSTACAEFVQMLTRVQWLSDYYVLVVSLIISTAFALSVICFRSFPDQPAGKTLESPSGHSSKGVFVEFPKFDPWKTPLRETLPVPYRPFRWGDYHVTMGIKPILHESWIELDHQHTHYHRLRASRARQHGSSLIQTLPADDLVPTSGNDAAYELAQELSEYLSRRYPSNYSVERHKYDSGINGWYGTGRIRKITMQNPINVTYDLDRDDPMMIAGLLVQDDLALMIEGKDGTYYLRAGAILTAGFWRLVDKVGMSLDDIHMSGNVPQYEQKLRSSMNRFMQRLTPDKLIQRNNYFFKLVHNPDEPVDPLDPNELGWAAYMVGHEDKFLPGNGLSDNMGPGNIAERSTKPSVRQMRLRMERQTLRRLPRTGAICFTIRTYSVPLEELAREPGVPGRAASAIRSWPEDVSTYKNRDQFAEFVLQYLDKCHQEQIENGIIQPDEKPVTQYPY